MYFLQLYHVFVIFCVCNRYFSQSYILFCVVGCYIMPYYIGYEKKKSRVWMNKNSVCKWNVRIFFFSNNLGWLRLALTFSDFQINILRVVSLQIWRHGKITNTKTTHVQKTKTLLLPLKGKMEKPIFLPFTWKKKKKIWMCGWEMNKILQKCLAWFSC